MRRQRCVGAIVTDEAGRMLVIRRARPPAAGLWSIPGGRVEPGESDAAAVEREVMEETGLTVVAGEHVGTVQRPVAADLAYEIHDYRATLAGGDQRAGDDAAEVRWVTPAELRALPTSPGMVEAFVRWRVLPG